MLQSGNAADLAGAFGGAGSQTAFGPRGAATFLSRATTWCAIVFMMTSLRSPSSGPRATTGSTGSILEQTQKAGTAPAKPAPRRPFRFRSSRRNRPLPLSNNPRRASTRAEPRSQEIAASATISFRPHHMRSWRNWQTHQLEGLAVARAWWFESTRPHQTPGPPDYFSRKSCTHRAHFSPRDFHTAHNPEVGQSPIMRLLRS